MQVNYKELNDGLEKLNGFDFSAAEQQTRLLGDGTPDVLYSKTFHAVIAAKVLKVTPDDIKELPIKDYVAVTSVVANFLLGTLAEQTLQNAVGK